MPNTDFIAKGGMPLPPGFRGGHDAMPPNGGMVGGLRRAPPFADPDSLTPWLDFVASGGLPPPGRGRVSSRPLHPFSIQPSGSPFAQLMQVVRHNQGLPPRTQYFMRRTSQHPEARDFMTPRTSGNPGARGLYEMEDGDLALEGPPRPGERDPY